MIKERAKEQPTFDDPNISSFVEKHIKPEDFEAVKKLSDYCMSNPVLISEFHNVFMAAKEKSVQDLEDEIKFVASREKKETGGLKDVFEQKKEFYNLMLSLTRKYDWLILHNLIRTFEGEHGEY